MLSGLHTWVADVPSGLLPEFALPAFKSQTQKNLVLWSNLVYVLAWKFERWYLSADIECQRKLDVVDFHLWEELVQPPGIEPRPVLTHQKHGGKEFESWPSTFYDSSCTISEYIGAYLRDTGSDLCGEYLRASLAAIDLLFAMSLEGGLVTDNSTIRLRAASNHDTRALRTKRARRPTQGALSPDEEVLHSYLMALHGCEASAPNFAPYKNQGDVARVLSEKAGLLPFTFWRLCVLLVEFMEIKFYFKEVSKWLLPARGAC